MADSPRENVTSPASQNAESQTDNSGGVSADVELLRRAEAGEESAAVELYDRFSPDINRVVWKVLGGDADHNDLVHDIFLKIWKEIGRGRVKQPERLRNWIVAVAINSVRKELRRRYVRARLLNEEYKHRCQDVVVPDYETRDLLVAAYGILDKIAPEDRLAFTLKYLDDRPLGDIAEVLGCSVTTVKRRVSRAEKRLRVLAKKYPAIADRMKGDSASTTEDEL